MFNLYQNFFWGGFLCVPSAKCVQELFWTSLKYVWEIAPKYNRKLEEEYETLE